MKALNTIQSNLNDPMPMLLSKLWTFLSLNYILCDLLSNMEMSVLQMLLEGKVGGIPMTEGMLLFAGVSLEIPFLMIVLSAILPSKANWIANIAAAILMIVYQLGSFFFGSGVTFHYVFFSAIEILGNAAILMLALKWRLSSQSSQSQTLVKITTKAN
ncbi:MAG: hypothetical protein GT601_18710 [Acidaminobacter sp.]|uniref:DUF6326 family protein n=1 Tax=Acidaminobacter sp. TaxID=1872102 RepID=UPI001381BEA1|nr:DUF6326 family protein [Acidaminobacter sp.]MZQ99702.1 hypothetical protein [Acidaminobacter sp.]